MMVGAGWWVGGCGWMLVGVGWWMWMGDGGCGLVGVDG